MIMKRFLYILLAMALAFSSCEKEPINSGNNTNNNNNNQEQQGNQGNQGQQGNQGTQEPEVNWTWIYAGNFAYDMMDDCYLWKKEIKSKLKAWANNINVDPIAKVKTIRYKDSNGDDIDRWTEVLDDYASFIGDVSGVSTTYGYDFFHFEQDENKYDRALATVRYVYPGSPAEEAGIKRGDIIVKVNGLDIPINFVGNSGYLDTDFIYSEMIYSSSCTLTLSTGATVSMTAREMVENPVILSKVLDNGEKKIGYLHYTSFTIESCQYLIDACKQFKAEGVKELIIDLRYNGGGYVFTEELLMSMLAPQAAVTAGEVFAMEIYNDELMAEFEEEGESTESCFKTIHNYPSDTNVELSFDTSDANLDLDKIYVIVTDDSASASESLICCLKPFYQDNLVVLGKQTHGKFCAGYIIEAANYFNDIKKTYSNPEFQAYYSLTQEDIDEALDYADNGLKYAANWGIYVMFARYADRDGVTLSMPDGIKPKYAASDNPQDGYQLGDPEESMLKTTLRRAGFTVADPNTQQAPERTVNIKTIPFNRREKPGMVKIPTSLPKQFRGPLKPLTSSDQYNRAE